MIINSDNDMVRDHFLQAYGKEAAVGCRYMYPRHWDYWYTTYQIFLEEEENISSLARHPSYIEFSVFEEKTEAPLDAVSFFHFDIGNLYAAMTAYSENNDSDLENAFPGHKERFLKQAKRLESGEIEFFIELLYYPEPDRADDQCLSIPDCTKDGRSLFDYKSKSGFSPFYAVLYIREEHGLTPVILSEWMNRLSPILFHDSYEYIIPEEEIPTKDETIRSYLDQSYSSNREFAFQQASEELKSNREFVLKTVKAVPHCLQYVSEQLRGDREIVLAAVQEDCRVLKYAGREPQNVREIVLTAVKQNGHTLRFASKVLKNDHEIVLAAVKQNGNALQYASEELRNDREIVLTAVKQYGSALICASVKLRADREIVLAAVQRDGKALKFAGKELRNDRKVVLAAVKQDGRALEYAGEELRNDPEIRRAAGDII